jgi:hypothetical protein
MATNSSASRPFDWISTIPFLFVWIPAAVAILFLKFVSLQLNSQFGFDFWSLSLIDKLSIFRADILFCFLLVPLGLTLAAAFLPHRLSAPAFTAFSIFFVFTAYAEVKSFYVIGRLYSFNLLKDTIRWGWTDPTSTRAYLNPGGLLRLFALMGSAIAVSWWAVKRSNAIVQDSSVRRRWRKSVLAASLPLTAIVILPWLSRLHSAPLNRSIVTTAFGSFWGWEEEEEATSKQFNNLGPRALIQQYQDLAHVRPSEKDPRYWSKATDSDVLFFVFETGPAAMLPIDGNLDDFPNLRRLRDRAFVAPFHYSTYPFTNRALFSCFSSWYPASLMKDFVEVYPDLRTPGIIRELSNRGYQTANYSPFPWEQDYDVKAAKAIGFGHLSFAHDSARLNHTYDRPWMVKRSYDLDSLHLLESDVDGWLTMGKRFVAVFAPQLGHDPWSDVSPDGHLTQTLDRGRPLMALQDAYLGELLTLLESHHRLERTLIVVTGDHGPRTSLEDPDLQVGMIDDISFHVPLLVYASQVLKSTVTIPWVTSHIDLSPSLLDLLGVERERSVEQGSPIWDSDLQDRTTFFFGRHYFSADGYYSRRHFFMWNYFFDSVYRNEQQHFTSSNRTPPHSPTYDEVTRTIQRMVDLQQRWVAVFGRGNNPLQSSTPGRK